MDEDATCYGSRPLAFKTCRIGPYDVDTRLGGYWTTRGYANSRIANSRTGHLVDWSTRGLVNSRTRQLAYWTSRGLDNSRSRRCRQKGKLSTKSRRWHPRVVQSATCLVRALTSPRDVQSASRPVRELAIRELSNYRLGQLCEQTAV